MTEDALPRDDAIESRALALLRELLDLDAAARDGILQQRTDEPALIARVRQLLAQVDESELDAPAPIDLQFGPYRARERIGQGGMGEVFRAERADGSFQRHVAIKRMHGGYAGLAARFLRERQLLARLQHPNIAQLIDGGFDAHGQPWLAMELVAGEPIHRWCDNRRATLDTRVRLMIQLCRAVDHAHRHLIVHRDLKPGNVLVDADGNAKLLDFGIARLLDDDSEHTHAMTPAWSAPEQRNGEPATTASDLYQLGMLLRLLLSGFPPSPSPGRMSRQYDDLLLDDRPAAQALAEARDTTTDALARRLHGDLDAIVALATAEDPAQRYPAASAFAADLERWLDGLPVSARDTERGYRIKRAARRHWPVLAAAIAALAFLGYHLHSINDALRRVEAERAEAVAARERESRQRIEAERQRDQASALADYFAKLFEAPSTPDTVAGSMPARDLLDAGHRRLADDARMPGNVRAMLLIATADAYGHLSMPKERLDILRDTVASLERRGDTDPDVLANGQLSLAMALISQGAFAEASRAIEAGLALYDRKQAHDPNARIELLQWRGIVAMNTGDHASAREAYRRILAETAQSLHRQHAVRYRVTALANLAHSATDPEEAASYYRDALALNSTRDRENHTMRLSLTNGLAVTLASLDRTEEAADIVETGLRDGTRLGLEASREYGILLSTAGSIDQRRGHLVRGAHRLEDAHGRLRERHGATDRLVLMAAGEALLSALVIDDMAMIARLHASLAAAGAVSAQSKSRALASAYLACRHAPAAAQTAVVVERARAIAGSNALIARIDWPARCASAGKRINASGATGSAPAPRRTR